MSKKLIFVNSLFPCLSETFVFEQFEMLSAAGLAFDITSNHRPEAAQVHPQMRAIQSSVQYLCEASKHEVVAALRHCLRTEPARTLRALARLPGSAEPLRTALAQLIGAALILYRNPEGPLHLHAHFTYGAAAVVMWAKRLSPRVQYSLTLHGSDLIYDNPADLRAKLAEADLLVSISVFNRDYLKTHFPDIRPPRFEVIPMGIPPRPPPRYHAGAKALRILNIGRLSEHKAQHDLVAACARLKARGVPFTCTIIGTGPLEDALAHQIAAQRLGDCVTLAGARFHKEVLASYGEADLFVLSSITEGMPIVLMEAMQAGVPIVATRISAIPELVQDSALLVPPSNPTALADAIETLARNANLRHQLALRGPEIVLQQFDSATNHNRFKDCLCR